MVPRIIPQWVYRLEPAGLQTGSHGLRLAGASRSLYDPSQRGFDADFHAGGNACGRPIAAAGRSSRERRPGAARQHLPSSIETRHGDVREVRGYSRLHELAAVGVDGFRRVSNFLLARKSHHGRGMRRIHELRGQYPGSAESGTQHRYAEGDRRGHHDGARSMCAVHGRAQCGARRDGIDPPLGAAQPDRTRQFGPGPVRHRAGGELHGFAHRERACHYGNALRRLCHRRSRGRRKQALSERTAPPQ